MKKAFFYLLFLALSISFAPKDSGAGDMAGMAMRNFKALRSDYTGFYLDSGNLLRLGGALAGAGVMANSRADRGIQAYYSGNVSSRTTDDVSRMVKLPGEALIAGPVIVVSMLLFDEGSPEGIWAGRSMRALITGSPAGLFIQWGTGGGRPKEKDDSRWRPFKNNNGLSGHAFIGAVPFITAARMQDNAFLKTVLYGASALPALSRINDKEHFASQAALGWYLAYLSVEAVNRDAPRMTIAPMGNNGLMVLYSRAF